MIPNRRTATLAPEVAAYIAGLVDGEGTITLTRLHAGQNRRLVVSIANTEMSILDFVHDQIGTGKITRKRIASDRHTPSFCYSVASIQALDLLRQIESYLQSYKRERARLALLRYSASTPRNGKYTAETAIARAEFERDFFRITAATASSLGSVLFRIRDGQGRYELAASLTTPIPSDTAPWSARPQSAGSAHPRS